MQVGDLTIAEVSAMARRLGTTLEALVTAYAAERDG